MVISPGNTHICAPGVHLGLRSISLGLKENTSQNHDINMKFSLILGLCVHFWKIAGTQGNSGNINNQYLDTDLMKV